MVCLTNFSILRKRHCSLGVNKCHGDARFPGSARASDAMHIDFRVLRQIVVDHVRNIIDIKPASSDVGCHQHLDTALTETSQHRFTGILAHIAVQCFGREAAHGQFIGQFASAPPCAGKDQAAGDRFDFEKSWSGQPACPFR